MRGLGPVLTLSDSKLQALEFSARFQSIVSWPAAPVQLVVLGSPFLFELAASIASRSEQAPLAALVSAVVVTMSVRAWLLAARTRIQAVIRAGSRSPPRGLVRRFTLTATGALNVRSAANP